MGRVRREEPPGPSALTDWETAASGASAISKVCLCGPHSLLRPRCSPGSPGWCREEGSKTARLGDMEGSLRLLPHSSKDCLPPSLCFSRKWSPVEEKRPCENISMNLCHSSGGHSPSARPLGLDAIRVRVACLWLLRTHSHPGACWVCSRRTLARL